MFTRQLGQNNITVSALGLGCWAIGGPFWRDGRLVGWGDVDDAESIRAVERTLELGLAFFDTSDVYGCGHSERILGQVLAGRRDAVVIAAKFGNVFDEQTRQITGADASPAHIRRACEASLRRMNTDYIDLYQFHLGDYDCAAAVAVRETLEDLVAEGKIRAYGWSTDDPERARVFAEGSHCSGIQQCLNLFEGNERTLAICESYNLTIVNCGPLGQGLLTGKFDRDAQFAPNDLRHGWDLREGERAERLDKLQALRDVLTSDGRTLAQGALAWLWARSDKTIPIPGFNRTGRGKRRRPALRSPQPRADATDRWAPSRVTRRFSQGGGFRGVDTAGARVGRCRVGNPCMPQLEHGRRTRVVAVEPNRSWGHPGQPARNWHIDRCTRPARN